MCFKELAVGLNVFDSWWPTESRGTVVRVLKTRVYVQLLNGDLQRYDRPHCRYLRRL